MCKWKLGELSEIFGKEKKWDFSNLGVRQLKVHHTLTLKLIESKNKVSNN